MIIQPVKAPLISLLQSPALPFENGGVVDATARILLEDHCHCISGSCTDSNGNIWNAVWRNGAGPSMVLCIYPNTREKIRAVYLLGTQELPRHLHPSMVQTPLATIFQQSLADRCTWLSLISSERLLFQNSLSDQRRMMFTFFTP